MAHKASAVLRLQWYHFRRFFLLKPFRAMHKSGFDAVNGSSTPAQWMASVRASAHRSSLVFSWHARLFQFGIVQEGVPHTLLAEIQKPGEHEQEHYDLKAQPLAGI